MCLELDYVVGSTSSLKEPGKFVGTKSFSLLSLGHYVTKVDLLKYKMKFDQNIKNNQLPKITCKSLSNGIYWLKIWAGFPSL